MDDTDLIKQKINIADLVSEYLPLKKAGVNFKANCPFHNEKSPSFMVSPERGIFHCFGCDAGGDIFKFLMLKEGIEFTEALEILAQKAGVVLKKTGKKDKDQTEKLFEANQKAAQLYSYLLTEDKTGKKAFEYLKGRGLTDETIKEFGIGYAPQNWESLTRFLKKRGYSVDEMVQAGLCVPSQRGCYDRFRGRITFPLMDVRNRVLGFSGRIVDTGEPKYMNTPQTLVFDKGKFLFGIHLSKNEIKQKNEAIIAEGEMDMIMSYQSGVKNIIASKGTALTEMQVELIKRYTQNISLCFDTDLAGDAAARRGIEIADKAGLNIKVIRIEGAKDPGELCQKDPEAWKKAVEEAVPIYDYYLDSVSRRYSLKTAEGKRAIFTELLPIWRKITDPIVKDHYIQKLSAMLQINEDLITRKIDEAGKALISAPSLKSEPKKELAPKQKIPIDRRKLLEEYLIAMLTHIPQSYTYVPTFPETLFTQEDLRQIYVLLVLFLDNISFKGRSFKIAEFVKSLPEGLVPLVDRLYLWQIDEKLTESKYWQKELDLTIGELKKMLIRSSLEKLSLQIKNAQAFEKQESLDMLNRRFRDLSVKLKNL